VSYGTPPGPGGYGTPPPGAGGYGQPAAPPPNYLVWAILTTLFCCLPGGVASIVFATQVNGKYQRGDYAGAQKASKNAKTWAIVAAAVGLPLNIILVILNVMSAS
jgi:uncharacterized protein YceK